MITSTTLNSRSSTTKKSFTEHLEPLTYIFGAIVDYTIKGAQWRLTKMQREVMQCLFRCPTLTSYLTSTPTSIHCLQTASVI